MNIILVAWDDNMLIGKDNGLPWGRIKEDLPLFKARTLGHACIMGHNTFKSLKKPLSDRLNIVLSHSNHKNEDNVEVYVKTWNEAFKLAEIYAPGKDVFIIGGAKVYQSALENNLVDKMIISKFHGFFKGDTYFPKFEGWEGRTIMQYEEFDLKEYIKS